MRETDVMRISDKKKTESLPLRYVDKDNKPACCERVRLTRECAALPQLPGFAYQLLKQDIQRRIEQDEQQVLKDPITVDEQGRIIDGRHRASALIELGKLDELIEAIADAVQSPDSRGLASFPWAVVSTPTSISPAVQVARIQNSRRNIAQWRIAVTLLRDYVLIAHDAKRHKEPQHGVLNDDGSPFASVSEFCNAVRIGERTFQNLVRIKVKVPDVYHELMSGKITYSKACELAFSEANKAPKKQKNGRPRKAKNSSKRSASKLVLKNEQDADALFDRIRGNVSEPLIALLRKIAQQVGLEISATSCATADTPSGTDGPGGKA